MADLTYKRCCKARPCPVCGRDKDCSVAVEGPLKCMWARSKGGGVPGPAPSGFKLGKVTRDGGFMYFPAGSDGRPIRVLGELEPDPRVVAEKERKAKEYKEKQIRRAGRVWEAARAVMRGGRKAEALARLVAYFRFRGIEGFEAGHVPADLAFDPECFEGVELVEGKWVERKWPAMVAAVRNYRGEIEGVHRTFLAKDGPGKRDSEHGSAKMMLGACDARSIRLGSREELAGGVLLCAEGIETGLACREALRVALGMNVAVWVGMSEGHLRKMLVPRSLLWHGRGADGAGGDGGVGGPIHTILVAADWNQAKSGRAVKPGWDGIGVIAGRMLVNRLLAAGPWLTGVVRAPSPTCTGLLRAVDDDGDEGVAVTGEWTGVDWLDVLGEVGGGDYEARCGRVAAGLMAGVDLAGAAARKAGWDVSAAATESPSPTDPPTDDSVTREEGGGARDAEDGSGGEGGDDGGGVGGGVGGGGGGRPWVTWGDWRELPVLEEGSLERARRWLWNEARIPGHARFAIARWGGEWWAYQDGRYIQLSEEEAKGPIWHWMNGFQHYKRDKLVKFEPTEKAVMQVLAAMAVDTAVRTEAMPVRMPPVIDAGGRPLWGMASSLGRVGRVQSEDAAMRELRELRGRVSFLDRVLDVVATARTGKVTTLEHSPDVFHATLLPFRLPAEELQALLNGADPGVVYERLCPKWWSWLAVAGEHDPDWERQLQDMMGDTISLDRSIEKIFCLVGVQRSGKGIVENAIVACMGRHNVGTTSFSALANDRHALSPLLGRGAIIMPDGTIAKFADGKGSVELLKVISGQGVVQVRGLYEEGKTVRLGGRLWIMCNEEPDLRDDSSAMANRFVFLPMKVSAEGKEDPTIKEAVWSEAPGILLWSLMGAIRLARMERRRISVCGEGLGLMEEYEERSAPLKAFARDWLVAGEELEVQPADLYEAYVMACEEEGRPPIGKGNFFKKMKWTVRGGKTVQRRVAGTDDRVRVFMGCDLRADKKAAVALWRTKRGGKPVGDGGDDRFWDGLG